MIVGRHGRGVILQGSVRNDADRAARRRINIDVKIHFTRSRVRVFADRSGVHVAFARSVDRGRVVRIDVLRAVLIEHAADRREHLADIAVEIFLCNIHAEHGDQRQQQDDEAPEQDRRALAAFFRHVVELVVVEFFVVFVELVVKIVVAAGHFPRSAPFRFLRLVFFLVVELVVVEIIVEFVQSGRRNSGLRRTHVLLRVGLFRRRPQVLPAVGAKRRIGNRSFSAKITGVAHRQRCRTRRDRRMERAGRRAGRLGCGRRKRLVFRRAGKCARRPGRRLHKIARRLAVFLRVHSFFRRGARFVSV